MRTLDIKYYALVHAIAESGSAKGAAALLNLTQSAISHRMREMERRLAITLFERRGHKVYLTPAAHRLLSTAREIIPKMIDAERDAVVLAQSAQPALRWGIDAHDVVQQLLSNDFDMLESNIGISRATAGKKGSGKISVVAVYADRIDIKGYQLAGLQYSFRGFLEPGVGIFARG